jgi:predicted N-acetyltransferase YhbS
MELVSLNTQPTSEIEALLDSAFGIDRKKRTAYMLREGTKYISALSFAILKQGTLIACIQCWPVRLLSDRNDAGAPMVLVGPVAVAPDHQNRGYGGHLMQAMLDAVKQYPNQAMIMIGDPEYYSRYGFYADGTGGWQLPGPWEAHRLLLNNAGKYELPIHGMLAPDRGE